MLPRMRLSITSCVKARLGGREEEEMEDGERDEAVDAGRSGGCAIC